MIAVFFGIPGVGKSTIVRMVSEKLNLAYLHPGNIIEEIAMERNLIDHVDQIRKLRQHIQDEMQNEMVRRIVNTIEDNPGKHYLIDTHAIVKTPQGYFPGLRNNFFEEVKPNIYVVVESPAENILVRRVMDETRERKDDHSLREIELHLELTRDFAINYTVMTGSNLHVVENKQGDLEYAVDEVADVLTRLLENQ